jgi:hypothetical protein
MTHGAVVITPPDRALDVFVRSIGGQPPILTKFFRPQTPATSSAHYSTVSVAVPTTLWPLPAQSFAYTEIRYSPLRGSA